MIIGRQFTFDSSHFLLNHPKCGEIHGHTWTLWVDIEGPIDPTSGMVADFTKIKNLVNDLVINQLDHKLLNNVFTEGILASRPTCENLAIWIANRLSSHIPELITKLYITIQEGKGGYCKHVLELR